MMTGRQEYFALPADTQHPGHPGNELGQNPEASSAYWYKRALELHAELMALRTAVHAALYPDHAS